MGRKRDAAEVKSRLLAELGEARIAITREAALAQVQLSPAAIARRSLDKHRWAWVAGGAIAGLLFIRILLPPKFRSDNSGKPARKRGVTAFASGFIFDLARRALTNYASTHLREHAQNYLDTILNRQDQDPV